jgi:metal-dependent HD superfamily phosphatase/phosphodiesterase
MDPVRQYRERFWSLWTVLKKFFTANSSCNGNCHQGRNCNCKITTDMRFSDTIIRMHYLASTMEDFEESLKVRLLADELAKIGNRLHEKNLENSKSSLGAGKIKN